MLELQSELGRVVRSGRAWRFGVMPFSLLAASMTAAGCGDTDAATGGTPGGTSNGTQSDTTSAGDTGAMPGNGTTSPMPADPTSPGPTQPDPMGGDPTQPDPMGGDPTQPDPMGGDPTQPDPMDPDPMQPDPMTMGPMVLPSPDEMGPYEVIEVENVGEGFENAIASGDRGDGLGCLSFIMSFGQDAESARNYALIPEGHDMALYTLYRPAEIPEGVALPALSWANGTCAHPVGYAAMFRHIVSHGFIIVAAHSRYTGSGAAQINGLDYLVAENENPSSPLFGHIDTDALGIFGHSQGSSSTARASADPRVRSVVFMHGGTANPDAPALFLTSDLEARGVMRGYTSATGRAAYGRLEDSDHITMMVEHERMAPEVTAWFRYTLLPDDMEAASWFVGADCLLCDDPEWEYMAKGLD